MGRVFVLLAMVSCCIVVSHGGQKLNCECGVAKHGAAGRTMFRIIGGQPAEPHSLPWMAVLTDAGKQYCGGSIITDRHVLTAAHCVYEHNYRHMAVLYGAHNLTNDRQVTKRLVDRAVMHEEYEGANEEDNDKDIAIVYVDKPVRFNEKIIPICLPAGEHDCGGMVATVAGWGRLRYEGGPIRSDVLMQTKVKIWKQEDCYNSELGHRLTSNMMCASSRGRDGCKRDSGGPLIVTDSGKYQQAGIVSWGIECGNSRYPGIYVNVSKYTDWIREKTADGAMCAN